MVHKYQALTRLGGLTNWREICAHASGGTNRSDSLNTNCCMAARLSQAGTEFTAVCISALK
jgi:L-alanine-DL-glutamate epimerase-like enolase superfamily enzyme